MARTAEVTVDRSRLVRMVTKVGARGMSASEIRNAFSLDRNRPARVAMRKAVKDKELRMIKQGRQLYVVTPDIRKLEREDERTERIAKEDKATKSVTRKVAKKAGTKVPAKSAKKAPVKSAKRTAKKATAKEAETGNGVEKTKPAKATKAPAKKPAAKKAKKTAAPNDEQDSGNDDDLLDVGVKTTGQQEAMTEH